MIVGSKTFATEIEDPIQNKLNDVLFCLFYDLSRKFIPNYGAKPKFKSFDKFDKAWDEEYAVEFRDLALKLFKEAGFNVESDGKDF